MPQVNSFLQTPSREGPALGGSHVDPIDNCSRNSNVQSEQSRQGHICLGGTHTLSCAPLNRKGQETCQLTYGPLEIQNYCN